MNDLVIHKHFLQSKLWREVKENLGNKTFDFQNGWFQTTKLPVLNKFVGYAPRIDIDNTNFDTLVQVAKETNCIFVKVDPNNYHSDFRAISHKYNIKKSKPVHLQKDILVDLTLGEEELWNRIKSKVKNKINKPRNDGCQTSFGATEENFKEFLSLYSETSESKHFSGRGSNYLTTVWNTLGEFEKDDNETYRMIVTTKLNNRTLVSSFIFLYEGVLYYTYTGSSFAAEDRKIGASYLHVWNIFKWGSENGLKIFDFWGVEDDMTSGFSYFKTTFEGELIEYANTFDIVINPLMYNVFNLVNKFR
ncbi:peptidoglycan bridge formation glycyltransferase FemA/FemB family protein [Candidatus Dojkabacteria bacterium]|uniref:Peptidoglycan bridge formation glycyltransferase FemA/FemB family protein n=1 Tax=Candidatus Dojkabacteria bacterium TaxID=2099670 RepID=A0A955IBH6_9BACT|nr:peptidoglycan bridge formation glycyltransferase FemA/FemB family protein [Candidatus Dojkabacteria bacterium]